MIQTAPHLELLEAQPVGPPTGPPVLFVHGARHAAWCWAEHFLPYFAEHGIPAFALSLRGHGGSSGREQNATYHLADYVEDIHRIMTDFSFRPVLVGHSMGGALVQLTLEHNPGCASAMVLLASPGPSGITFRDDLRLRLWGRQDLKMLQLYGMTQGKTSFPARVLFSKVLEPASRDRYIAQLQPESPFIQAELHGCIIKNLNRISVPVLVLGGKKDWFLSPAAVRRAARAYHVSPMFFQAMAHDMMLEPGWPDVAEAIIHFIKALK